jgi:hypothetical protein
MIREKQIEEMAKHCHFYEEGNCLLCEECIVECDMDCDLYIFAKMLYNAGYRKSTDVAEEIFAEIEKETEIGRIMNACAIVSLDAIAELKKKYTEEGK